MRNRSKQPGFTLIELVLVMVIIGAMLAVVAPSLGRMRSRSRVDDTAAQLRSMVELARTRAVADGRATRVVVDATENLCWIEHLEGGGFMRTPASHGAKVELDDGIEVTSDDAATEEAGVYLIRAEPDGRVAVAQLRLLGIESGRERVVFTRSVTEPYRVGDEEDAALYAEGGVYAP